MKKVIFSILTLVFIVLNFNGCGVAKVYNVNEPLTNSKELSLIKDGILRAGNSLGWNMKAHPDGYIIGIIVLRSHSATVKITYNENSYKIDYLSSVNLNYNEKDDTVQTNYNGWISNLRNTINNYLSDLSMNDELQEKAKQSNKDKLSSSQIINGQIKIQDINKNFNQKDNIDSVSNSIIEAGNSLGWNMKLQENGLILGKIVLRTHSATIKIDYNKNSYKITYITSTNLNYTSDYTIHKNYNGWITNLTNAVDSYLNSF